MLTSSPLSAFIHLCSWTLFPLLWVDCPCSGLRPAPPPDISPMYCSPFLFPALLISPFLCWLSMLLFSYLNKKLLLTLLPLPIPTLVFCSILQKNSLDLCTLTVALLTYFLPCSSYPVQQNFHTLSIASTETVLVKVTHGFHVAKSSGWFSVLILHDLLGALTQPITSSSLIYILHLASSITYCSVVFLPE